MKTSIRFNKKAIVICLLALLFLLKGITYAEAHRPRGNRVKLRTSRLVHTNSGRACYILFKKRNAAPKSQVRFTSRKVKYKPMAETDTPAWATR